MSPSRYLGRRLGIGLGSNRVRAIWSRTHFIVAIFVEAATMGESLEQFPVVETQLPAWAAHGARRVTAELAYQSQHPWRTVTCLQ